MLKSILNLIPGVIGIAQAILPLLKEIAIAVIRIIAVLPFAWKVAEPLIGKVNKIYDKIYGIIEKVKNYLLWIPKLPAPPTP